jgi:hypothetical protein
VERLGGRLLNHVELVYRPGERELAKRFFELLGCRVLDRGGEFFSALVDPDVEDGLNNVLYASEVTPAQWALDQALLAFMDGGTLSDVAGTYLELLQRQPQRSFHFGLRYPDLHTLEAAVERIRDRGARDPLLAGRVAVSGVFRPGDPGSYTDTMVQAFVRTNLVAAGLLAFPQHVELQWQVPAKAS